MGEAPINPWGRVALTALNGTCVLAVIELLGQSSLDSPLTFSLYCFAVAVPLLTLVVAVSVAQLDDAGRSLTKCEWGALKVGIVAALVGIGATFFHFSCCIGIVFAVAGACSVVEFGWSHKHRRDQLLRQ